MPALILPRNEAGARRLALNRPAVRNALNFELVNELIDALRAAKDAPEPVILLSGEGGTFSSGGDIQDMAARRGQAVLTFERLRAGLTRLIDTIVHHPKPILAAVDGDCLGAGCGLALACDAILATEKSRFGFPFVKVGLVPDTGTSWLLPHVAGIQTARRLLLTGDSIPAAEAASLGLVTQLYADAAALESGIADWTKRLAAIPPTAIAHTKRLLWDSVHQPLPTAVLNEAMLQAIRFTTEEHAKAADAFLARKKG